MSRDRREHPLLYFRRHVHPDIEHASTLDNDLHEGPRTRAEEAPTAIVRGADGAERIESLIRIRQSSSAGDASISVCLDLAFSDPDAQVRGTAWIALNDISEFGNRMGVIRALARALASRFTLDNGPDPDEAESIAQRWLQLIGLVNRAAKVGLRHFAAYAGSDQALLESDPRAAERFLDHPNPARRCAALFLLARNRHLDETAIARILAIVASDPVPMVRNQAIRAASRMAAGEFSHRIKRTLAEIVLNESEREHLRASAYLRCYALMKNPTRTGPREMRSRLCPPFRSRSIGIMCAIVRKSAINGEERGEERHPSMFRRCALRKKAVRAAEEG